MIIPQVPGSTTASSAFAIQNRLDKLHGLVDLEQRAILDVGCNNGAYTLHLAQAGRVTVGIDLEREQIAVGVRFLQAYALPVDLLMMSAEQMGFHDSSFDVVFLSEALEHISDQDTALDEIHRVLRNQGTFVLFAPNRLYLFETHGMRIGQRTCGRFVPLVHWLPRRIGRHLMNARSYTPGELRHLLEQHHFRVIHMSCLFPPFDGLKARLERYRLGGLIDAYRQAIGLIDRLPFVRFMGLSLFVVAIKD